MLQSTCQNFTKNCKTRPKKCIVGHPGQLASKMEMEREALCRRNGWSFSPFAMETIGVCGGKANSLLQKLVNLWANNNGCSKSAAPLLCRSRLQLALLRGMARQLERGFPLPQPLRTCTRFKVETGGVIFPEYAIFSIHFLFSY